MHAFQGKIPGRSPVCSGNKEVFTDGMEIVSILKGKIEYVERKDFCSECFDRLKKEKKLKKAWGIWKGKFKPKSKKEKTKTPDEKALVLLKEMLSNEKSETFHMAYVLARYLERCSQLVLRRELMDSKNSEILFFEDATTSEILCIKKMETSFQEIQALQKEIISQLHLDQ